jgi:hypothetical protein
MTKALLWLLLGAGPYTPLVTTYKPLEDYPWSSCYRSSFYPDASYNYKITYQYCSFNEYTSPQTIAEQIRYDSNLFFQFAEERNFKLVQCKDNSNLEIFMVPDSVLNDHELFNQWQANYQQIPNIVGLYDARNEESGVSAIILIDRGFQTNKIFAHEMGHFWYDRFCLGTQFNYQVELFAEQFELYYLESRR